MHYTRKISAFAVDGREEWIYAGTIGGTLLTIPADEFRVTNEAQGHAGGIESIAVHPTLPYAASLAVDASVCLWSVADPRAPKKLQTISLRAIRSDGQEADKVAPLSCPIAFHPTERRLLTHNATAAVAEIAFDDTSWTKLWAAGLFFEDDGVAYDADFVRYLEGSDHVFASTFGGHVAVIDPKRPSEPIVRWRYDKRTIHCATHLEGSEYLLASDTRRIIRFDATGKKEPEVGPPVMRDHLEQVAFNRSSGKIYASSFDRTVIEVDRATLKSKGVVLETPFKLRWIHSFERDPSTLVVQCRNGALYRASLKEKRCTGVIKETPNALWTGVRTSPKDVVIAGEGPEALHLRVASVDPQSQETKFEASWKATSAARGTYAKRLVRHEPTRTLVEGRIDGRIYVHKDGATRELLRFPSALRDVAVSPEGFDLFAVTEDGRAHRVDLETGRVLAQFDTGEEPLWSLAYNHERRLLAVCERQGALRLLDADTLTERLAVGDSWAPKRMKWLDADRLLAGRGAELYLLDVTQGEMRRVVEHVGNTIEDFGWSDDRRFLAVASYGRRVNVYDLGTWLKLDSVDFDHDFPKGLVWLDPARAPGAHPYELLVFGRSGVALAYRVHDERLHKLGPVHATLSTPIHDDAGVTVP
jgi:WD40 repeat protein